MAEAVEDLVFCQTFIVITQQIPARQSTGMWGRAGWALGQLMISVAKAEVPVSMC